MDTEHEARRQHWLLQALRGDATAAEEAQAWLGGTVAAQAHGLRAYRANAAAGAARALAAAYPTVQQLVGADTFAALAAALWQAQPPAHGDLALWGAGLPSFIAEADALASEPYLADVARLDWALHQAERAADDDAPASGLQLLGEADPARLRLRLRSGHAVLASRHPVHSIWAAHHSSAADRFAVARQALAAGRGEALRVRRQGWQVVVEPIDTATTQVEAALLQGLPLATVLTAAGPGFDFEAWFITSLRHDSLAAVLLDGAT